MWFTETVGHPNSCPQMGLLSPRAIRAAPAASVGVKTALPVLKWTHSVHGTAAAPGPAGAATQLAELRRVPCCSLGSSGPTCPGRGWQFHTAQPPGTAPPLAPRHSACACARCLAPPSACGAGLGDGSRARPGCSGAPEGWRKDGCGGLGGRVVQTSRLLG